MGKLEMRLEEIVARATEAETRGDALSIRHTGIKPINVFLLSEHRIVLWGLERLLNAEAPRMKVCGTATSQDELELSLTACQPDIILMDLDWETGYEVALDFLGQLARRDAIPVLAITAHCEQTVHQEAIISGARGVIRKQHSVESILRAVEKVNAGEIWLDRMSVGRVLLTLSTRSNGDPETAKIATLTAKERSIVHALVEAQGESNKVVADKLHVSEHTLRNHMTTIYKKLDVRGRLGLYLYATRHAKNFAGSRYPSIS